MEPKTKGNAQERTKEEVNQRKGGEGEVAKAALEKWWIKEHKGIKENPMPTTVTVGKDKLFREVERWRRRTFDF